MKTFIDAKDLPTLAQHHHLKNLDFANADVKELAAAVPGTTFLWVVEPCETTLHNLRQKPSWISRALSNPQAVVYEITVRPHGVLQMDQISRDGARLLLASAA